MRLRQPTSFARMPAHSLFANSRGAQCPTQVVQFCGQDCVAHFALPNVGQKLIAVGAGGLRVANHACTRWGLGVGHAGTALGRAHPYLADVDRLRFGVPVREGCEHDTCCDRIGEPEVPLKNENRERTHVLSGRVDVGHEGRAVDYVAAGPWSFTAAWHMRTVPSDDAYVQVSPSASGPTHPGRAVGTVSKSKTSTTAVRSTIKF